jgi:GNAT superfamily N-acetyltransferase
MKISEIKRFYSPLESGNKNQWHSGEAAFFEYHCNRAHDSGDAEVWYRSHQPVTILKTVHVGVGRTFSSRGNNGEPKIYKVKWNDGFEHDVFEDELFSDSSYWNEQFCPPPQEEIDAARNNKSVTETTLSHTEEDDKYFDSNLDKDYNRRECEPVGTIGNLQVVNRNYPYGKVYFFLHDGKPVGTAIVQKGGRAKVENADWYSVTLIYLRKQYRQKGLGTEFYKLLINQGHKLKPDTKQSAGGEGMWKSLRRNGLTESFMYPIGSEMPDTIIDYRDPEKSKAKFIKYTPEQLEKFKGESWFNPPSKGYRHNPPDTKLTLTKDGKVIVFYWGDDNIIPWKDLVDIIYRDADKELQDDPGFGLAVKGKGYFIKSIRETGGWSGDRTKYSRDIKNIAQALLDRKAATPETPIYIGHYGNEKNAEYAGTIAKIIATPDIPKKIIVYHGTSTYRYSFIEKHGLKALPAEDRVWNRGKLGKNFGPEHRNESVYLTASLSQAQYYSRKATNIDRKRYGPSKRQDAYHLSQRLEQSIRTCEYNKEQAIKNPDELVKDYANYYGPGQKRQHPEFYDEMIAKAKAQLEKLTPLLSFHSDIKPVVLQIELKPSDYKFLMADDDYLDKDKTRSPSDWRDSLSVFGQIAFKGTIPPSRIKVV